MSARGRGWIINVGSVNALITQNNYSAIKAWVGNYSESLGVQLAGTGVQVTALMPGWVRTEMGGADADIDVATSVTGMADVIAARLGQSGTAYLDYTGKTLDW